MIIHQSDLSSWTRCPQAMFLQRQGRPSIQTSALSFGTVMHYAIECFEREWRTGNSSWADAKTIAIETFRHYWHPMHIDAVSKPVELWLPHQSYAGLARIGAEGIAWYAECFKDFDEELLATEFGFSVPIDGTWDYDLGEPHLLNGTLDRLSARYIKRHLVLDVGDLKGLALDTPIPTPGGWTTMGAVQVGDPIFGGDGKPYPVIAKSEVHLKPCYKITFDDASSIVADHEHLWVTQEGQRFDRREVRSTEWLARNLLGPEGRQRDKRVMNTEPLDLPDAQLPIEPYVLGVWLSKPDEELWDLIRVWDLIRESGFGIGCSPGMTRTVLGLRTQLRRAGLLGHKEIPDVYLRGSLNQRLALLQGLMDSDGCWNRCRNQAVFTSTNKGLAEGVQELVHSMGWRANLSVIERSGYGLQVTAYDVKFTPYDYNPFRLPRKRDLVVRLDPSPGARARRRIIASIERIETVRTQCIAVGSPDATYLCGHQMIPTHNTGKDYLYLRQNVQFSAYTYATTCREFWVGHNGEDGFGDRGEQLYSRFAHSARHASWISLKGKKVMDAGWRGPDDWTRFALAVEQVVASMKADIYPLNMSGENCSYCPQRNVCAGVGVPDADHGAPAR